MQHNYHQQQEEDFESDNPFNATFKSLLETNNDSFSLLNSTISTPFSYYKDFNNLDSNSSFFPPNNTFNNNDFDFLGYETQYFTPLLNGNDLVQDKFVGLSENLKNEDGWKNLEKCEDGLGKKRKMDYYNFGCESSEEEKYGVNVGDGKGKTTKKGMTAKNLMAERRRRKKLNDRLYMLRSIIPKISKVVV